MSKLTNESCEQVRDQVADKKVPDQVADLLYLSQRVEIDRAGPQCGQALFWWKAGFKQDRSNGI